MHSTSLTMKRRSAALSGLNLVAEAQAFTLGTIFALMLALGTVVIAPIVLSQLGSSGATETLVALGRWPILLGLGGLGVDDSLLYRYGSKPLRAAVDLALPRQCHGGSVLAGPLWIIFLVHSPFR